MRQIWLILLVGGLSFLGWYMAIGQLLLGKPMGSRPAPDLVVFIMWILFGFGMPWFFMKTRLETEIRTEGIWFRLFPLQLQWRSIPYDAMASIEAISYHPIRDYGGWGIRYGLEGKAYTLTGDRGIRMTGNDGARLLLGCQDPDRLVGAALGTGRVSEPPDRD